MALWQWLGELHPKLVQFPLVLCLAGLGFDLWGWLRRSDRAHWAGLCLTAAGTFGLLFTFICGIYAEISAGRAGISQHPIELHELLATFAAWGLVLLLAWRIFLVNRQPAPRGIQNGTGDPGELPPAARKRGWMAFYLAVGFFSYGLLVLTAYLGGQLVFQYGAGVSGLHSAPAAMTLADLNTLAARQTDENLRYSEWMHHVFGVMTLGLAVSLLTQTCWPAKARGLKWIVPAFLLAGGLFLFFMADRDLYALNDPRQWRDREVLLHKTLATVMAVIGAVGLWKLLRTPRQAQGAAAVPSGPGGAAAPAPPIDPRRSELNSKLVAVLALIGGALLFTHVHTVAPYANVAAGVYIAHVVLGLVALSIGITRLLQEHLADPRRRRALAALFAGLMLLEATLLLSYNEGLPWYIGYGRYDRWGPGHDRSITVAPFGNFRALLSINPAAGRVVVVFRNRLTDDPVVLTLAAPPQLVVAQGYEELAFPLAKSPVDVADAPTAATAPAESELTGSNFRADAEYFKRAAWLSARLVLQVEGEHGGHARELVGYFDPWVTPAITAVPPNEVAAFVCPMHDGIRATHAGTCPLCGMALMPITAPRPAGTLADADFDLRVTVEKQHGLQATFGLSPMKGNAPADLVLAHEQWMHLMIVSQDLSYFDHLHPRKTDEPVSGLTLGPISGPMPADDEPKAPFALAYTFPREGFYVLFGEYMPTGQRAQSFRVPVIVDGAGVRIAQQEIRQIHELALDGDAGRLISPVAFPKTPLDSAALDPATATPNSPKESAIQVQLLPQPRTLYAGLHAELVFRLADAQGQPVTTLAPYLGAMGHCVAVSEDTGTFLHFHPDQFQPTTPEDRGGPTVAFHATFPAPGRYRIWAQFHLAGPAGQNDDRLLIAPFNVEVVKPLVPAGIINLLLNDGN